MTSANIKKRRIFSETDAQLLIECISKYKTIIDDKKTNGKILALKLKVSTYLVIWKPSNII